MQRFLPVAVKNSGVSLEELLPDALAEKPSLPAFELISKLYRQLAVGSFLMSGNPQDLAEHLFNSSRAFAHFCDVAPAGAKLTSRAEAFFDAVACRDDDGARRIAAGSPSTPDPSREYEEDFYKIRFAMDLWSQRPRLAGTDAGRLDGARGGPGPLRRAVPGDAGARPEGVRRGRGEGDRGEAGALRST